MADEAPAPRKRATRKPKLEETTVVVESAEEVAPEPEPVRERPVSAKFVAGRRMVFNGVQYEPGDPVPGAENAARVETLIANRYLKAV